MSVKGSPYARFRRAVEGDSAALATAVAHELPRLTVADALRLCLVYARADPSRFDCAIVRLCPDAGGLDAATAQTAFAAATSLPGPHGRDAALLLAGIAAAHDLAYVAEVLDHWRERPDRRPRSQAAHPAPPGAADPAPGRRGRPHPPVDAGVQASVR